MYLCIRHAIATYPRTWEESFHMDMIWRNLKISGNVRVLPVVPRDLAPRKVCFCHSVSRRVINHFSRYAGGKNKPPGKGNSSYNPRGNGSGPRSLETRHNPSGGDIESAIWTFDASTQNLFAIWTNSDFCTFSIRFIGVTNSLFDICDSSLFQNYATLRHM